MSSNTKRKKTLHQWLWFVGLYVASLICLGTFMFVVRTILGLNH